MTTHGPGNARFTFMEILIAVVILASIAALVVPQFGQASVDPDLAALSATLQTVRTQLQYYRVQHDGSFPSFDDWEAQMLDRTRPDGTLSTRGSCGPYLLQVPANPVDGSRRISPTADGTGGWAYDEQTGHFQSNDSTVITETSQTSDL